MILLPGLALVDARNVRERLRQSLDASAPFHSTIGPLPGVTISLGVAVMQQDQGLDSLISLADQAKAQGRNRVCG